MIQALPIVANSHSPQGLAKVIIAQLKRGEEHSYWDDFAAGLPIGTTDKPEWEVEPGVPYPMFIEYLTEKIIRGNNTQTQGQARNEVFRILEKPRQAKAFWGQFKRSVVNTAEQVQRDRALGVSNPNTPVWSRERIEPSVEEAAAAGQKIMAVNGGDRLKIEGVKTPKLESKSESPSESDPWVDKSESELEPSSEEDKPEFEPKPSLKEMLAARGVKSFCTRWASDKPMPKVSREEAEAEAKAESEAIKRQQMNYKTHLNQMSLDEINELLKDPISRTELTPQLIDSNYELITDYLGQIIRVKLSELQIRERRCLRLASLSQKLEEWNMNTPDDNQLSLFSTPEPPLKSSFCDWESKLPNLLRSIPTHSKSSDTIFPTFLSTTISELTIQPQENSILSGVHFPVLAHQTQEAERDYSIQLHLFGERDLDVLLKLNPASVLSNNLKELSNENFELFLADSLWQDTLGRLRQSRRESLARVIKGSDYLSTRRLDMLLNQKHPPPSFPTLTSNVSTTSRPAGQTALLRSQSSKTTIWALALREKWFKDNGLIPNGSQLGTRAIALTMGFPSSWFEGLSEQYSRNQTTPSQGASRRLASRPPRGDDLRGCAAPQAESEQGIWQDEQLPQDKQRSHSEESSTSQKLLGGDEKLSDAPRVLEHRRGERSSLSREISIPCLVKQPKQAEVKGVIRKDDGDRVSVEVDGDEISVSKLFVYPDFSKSVGQINKCSSKTAASEQSKKATQSGLAGFPRELLRQEVSDGSSNCSSNITPPSICEAVSFRTNCSSKIRRAKGEGSGHIYYRTVTRNGKKYRQAYY